MAHSIGGPHGPHSKGTPAAHCPLPSSQTSTAEKCLAFPCLPSSGEIGSPEGHTPVHRVALGMVAPRLISLLPWWQPAKWKGCVSLWSDSPAFAARGERLLCHMLWGTSIVAFSFHDPSRLFQVSLIKHFFMFNWSHSRSEEARNPPLLLSLWLELLPSKTPGSVLGCFWDHVPQ